MVPAYSHAPLALKTPSKLRLTFGHFPNIFSIIFESPWGYRSLVPPWGHHVEKLFAQLVGEKEILLLTPRDSQGLVDGRLRKVYAKWRDGEFVRESEGLSQEAVLNYAAYDIRNPPEEYWGSDNNILHRTK